MGRLVQQPKAPGAHRQHTASRSRATLPDLAMTQTLVILHNLQHIFEPSNLIIQIIAESAKDNPPNKSKHQKKLSNFNLLFQSFSSVILRAISLSYVAVSEPQNIESSRSFSKVNRPGIAGADFTAS